MSWAGLSWLLGRDAPAPGVAAGVAPITAPELTAPAVSRRADDGGVNRAGHRTYRRAGLRRRRADRSRRRRAGCARRADRCARAYRAGRWAI